MTSQLLTTLVPGSNAFLIWPRDVASWYAVFPTSWHAVLFFRSRYLAAMGGMIRDGLREEERPALTVWEPGHGQYTIRCGC